MSIKNSLKKKKSFVPPSMSSASSIVDRATGELGKLSSSFAHVPEKLPELGAMTVGVWILHKGFDAIDAALGYTPGSGYADIQPMEQFYRAAEEAVTFTVKYVMAKSSGLALD